MPSLMTTTKLPPKPVQRLETFGHTLAGDVWKTALAGMMGVHKRTMSYWLAGHTPPDLDERLKVLATQQIAEQARCSDVLRAYRDQLEGVVCPTSPA